MQDFVWCGPRGIKIFYRGEKGDFEKNISKTKKNIKILSKILFCLGLAYVFSVFPFSSLKKIVIPLGSQKTQHKSPKRTGRQRSHSRIFFFLWDRWDGWDGWDGCDGWDGWMDGLMDGWMDGSTDGWIDGGLLGPLKLGAGQQLLDRTSVFPRKTEA